MPSISVNHSVALSDQPLEIRLNGFPVRQPVEVMATRQDLSHRAWRSWARFITDDTGCVDLVTQAPLTGTYSGVSPMGLFWSMELLADQTPKEPWRSVLEGTLVRVEAKAIEGDGDAECGLQRNFAAPGVTVRDVREDGIVGSLFLPAGDGPHPAIIVLTGSGGGINEPLAALLASHGFAALALGYFRMEGLPAYLANIPLEYFEHAITWLRKQPDVGADFLEVVGMSRGGELSLLLGATFPEVTAVVAYVPSGVIHGGMERTENGEWNRTAAWTYQDKLLPCLDENNMFDDEEYVDWDKSPIALRPIFENRLRDKAAIERSIIPVERINGPVLLISGTDDQMWPSTEMAELTARRLKQHNHPFPVEHLIYEGAGHIIYQPYGPITHRHGLHPVAETDYAYGGSATADAYAAADSWPRVLALLKQAARDRGSK